MQISPSTSRPDTLHANTTIENAFTGNDVYLQPILSPEDKSFSIANVTFTPGARTHWHVHEKGQILRVLTGSGWICDHGEKPVKISAGDVIWCPPGTRHWHGAAKGTIMCHEATSFGRATWEGEVKQEEYEKAGQ